MKSVQIILASRSPRRKELLARIIPERKFVVLDSNIPEKALKNETVEVFCQRIAEEKARNVMQRYHRKISNNALVIAADTVISIDNQIIGQPKDKKDAKKILRKLSGKRHEVLTGIALASPIRKTAMKFCVKSKVWMKKLNQKQINDYVASNEPMDKAGAYGIQGLGRKLIKKYQGSYTNIIGLPVKELRKKLALIYRTRTI